MTSVSRNKETVYTLEPKTLEGLQNLIRVNLDSRRGYEKAAEAVDSALLEPLFKEVGEQRGRCARELREFVRLNSKTPVDDGSLKATLHRAWIELIAKIKDGDEAWILSEVEKGEDDIKEAYEKTLKDVAGNPLSDILHRQYADVVAVHNRMRGLRDRAKKAAKTS
jgi:uncharacterized protein (TIGR02284 family)